MAARLRAGADPGPLLDTARESVELLDREIATLRALITDRRPAALDHVGVGPAIEDLVGRLHGRGLEVELDISLAHERGDHPDRLASDVETALYRIIQEGLNNARQHGAARQAWVAVDEDETTVRVMIRDDGHGFDTASPTSGFGLLGMHERAELAGGTLEISSTPGQGTTIRATFPARRRGGAQAA